MQFKRHGHTSYSCSDRTVGASPRTYCDFDHTRISPARHTLNTIRSSTPDVAVDAEHEEAEDEAPESRAHTHQRDARGGDRERAGSSKTILIGREGGAHRTGHRAKQRGAGHRGQ